jgi:hypothetical protein
MRSQNELLGKKPIGVLMGVKAIQQEKKMLDSTKKACHLSMTGFI